MKTKFKLILSVVICAMLAMPVSSAESSFGYEIYENEEGTERTLTVFGSGASYADDIRIEILKKNMISEEILSSYTKESFLSDFIILKQLSADENGEYELTADMLEYESGYYIVRVNGEDHEVYFSTNSDRQELIDEMKEICKKGEDETETQFNERAIKELAELFDIENEKSTTMKTFNINKVNAEIVFKAPVKETAKFFIKKVSDLTVMNFTEKLKHSALVAALNKNIIKITDYKTEFGLSSEYLDIYDEKITDVNKNVFEETYFKDKNYDNNESVQEAFNEAVIDSWCKYFENWADIEDIINKFGDELGILIEKLGTDTTKKSKLYENLADLGGFSGTDEFVEIANKTIGKISATKPSGGGSSGGGGGSSSGGGSAGAAGGTVVTKPIVSTSELPEAPTSESKDKFSDLNGFDWAKESIEALAEKGIVSGVGEGKYEPKREVKREEILAMLLRGFKVEASSEKSDFTDAADGAWYNGLLAVAKEKGFVSGRPDGSFGIGANVTRQDVAVMAYNIAKAMGKEFDAEKKEAFTDEADADAYAIEAIYALKNAGIINGKGEGLFAPKATCTRAEAAKIIYSLIKE